MKYLYLICLCISLTLTSYSQADINYGKYQNKEEVYFNDFNNPADTTWADSNVTHHIRDGYYLHLMNGKGFDANSFDVHLDPTKDYEIEFRAKAPHKRADAGILFWGRKDSSIYNSNYWYFHNSRFRDEIIHCTVENSCLSKRLKGKIYYHSFNKYTLRRIKGYYYFYINERQVKVLPATPLYGTGVGLGSGSRKRRNAEAIFDYIRISYLND